MSIEIIDFTLDYIDEAAVLSYEAQQKEFISKQINHKVTLEFCKNVIKNELTKETAAALMLLDDSRLVGFVIGVVARDEIWGDSGRVNAGCWGIDGSRKELLAYLYQKIAEEFVKQKIKQHYFQVWDNDREILDILSDLGFAKEQTYAALKLPCEPEFRMKTSPFLVRKAYSTDKEQLSQFSRLIAEYQMKTPCFASAPQPYLEALDDGFRGFLEDSEADVYVVEEKRRLIGYQAYYETEESLVNPPGSVELAVSGISEEDRGRGAGRMLTLFSLEQQQLAGYSFAVTDWRCANLLSSRFWKQVGFVPTFHRLIRRIDPLL
jgi:ribosomal protein S18 acetylase RimI-like enzyme